MIFNNNNINESYYFIEFCYYMANIQNTHIVRQIEKRFYLWDTIKINLKVSDKTIEFLQNIKRIYGSDSMNTIGKVFVNPVFINNNWYLTDKYIPDTQGYISRDNDVNKCIEHLISCSTLIINGSENTGKRHLADLVINKIIKEGNHRYKTHECIIIDGANLDMMLSSSNNMNISLVKKLLAEIELSRPIILIETGSIIQEYANSIMRTPGDSLLRAIFTIDTPKIVLMDEEYVPMLDKIIPHYKSYNSVNIESKEDESNIKKRMINDVLFISSNNLKKDITNKSIDEIYNTMKKLEIDYDKYYNTLLNSIQNKGIINLSKINSLENIKTNIKTLNKHLQSKIFGQNEHIEKIYNSILSSYYFREERPISTILLLGNPGVGKTEIAIQIANHLYGNKKQNLLRLDGAEFKEYHSISAIVGSPPGYLGYKDGSRVDRFLKETEGGVILFDEIEKMHEEVRDILLGMMDYGKLTMRSGIEYNIQNYVVVCTSNVKVERKRYVGFQSNIESDISSAYKTFRPELMDRFDSIIHMDDLTKEVLYKIFKRTVDNINSNHHITKKIKINKKDIMDIISKEKIKSGRHVELYVSKKLLPEHIKKNGID